MTFDDVFQLTDAAAGQTTAKSIGGHQTGAYNEGLLSIVDVTTGRTMLSEWTWLTGDAASYVIVYTGFGDAFIWHQDAVHYLDAQHGQVEFVDRDVDRFLDQFLVQDVIVSQILRCDLFRTLVSRRGPLNFGKCFILEPWEMLGGIPNPDNYAAGDVTVYLNLVGQALGPDV